MFHLLDGVPRPVSDALVAASISSSESATQSMNNVLAEIEKAVHEVPPSMKDALAAAVSSLGATCEENLATLYLCFSNEFDMVKKEHECRFSRIESENKSLILRVEQQANQLNMLLAKHQTEIDTSYHHSHIFSQSEQGCNEQLHGDQKQAFKKTLASTLSSYSAKCPNEQKMPACVAMVSQQEESNAVDRRYHQTNKTHQAQAECDQKHHHGPTSSFNIIQSTSQVSSCATGSPLSSQEKYKDVWNKHFNKLIEYKKRFGNCHVPLTYSENPSLALWVNEASSLNGSIHCVLPIKLAAKKKSLTSVLSLFNVFCKQQRVHYRNGLVGKTPTLSRIQIRCLEEIGFRWVAALLASWDDRFVSIAQILNRCPVLLRLMLIYFVLLGFHNPAEATR
ncbi:hypothetical protein HJC23_010879 [Cyclotella cryptica]|uniref:Helicase-associated domain-containing protein n=1 Tax=Cyclotella cryptica TaxID=29204 RepID=A0ABD3QPS0_9STRA